MKLYIEKEDCCGCGACADVCQSGAIRMVSDREGFLYPYIKKKMCVSCGKCKKVCPLKKKDINVLEDANRYFGVQNTNKLDRYASSSGGVFSLLAMYVLQQEGVVYGAGFDYNLNVMHRSIVNSKELRKIRKTKYVQSNMSGIYRDIEQKVKEGRWVLFCGTPCQAHALRLFLNKYYDKLIIIDLVCYGVASPGIWKKYINHLEHTHKGRIVNFLFRDKRNRDNGRMCSYVIGKRSYVNTHYDDVFCRVFFKNCSIRPSCHKCRFCTVKRCSDFTIGDFWGIEEIRPDLDDGMGTSMMILHTDKAKKIWNLIKKDALWFECKKNELIQPRLMSPTTIGEKRSKLMRMYKFLPFFMFVRLVKFFV